MSPWSVVQVTGIFGSSMEVYICVDGESPGSGPAAGGPQENGSNHGVEAAPGVFHCGSAFATVSFPAAFAVLLSMPSAGVGCCCTSFATGMVETFVWR
jgi:hypothetical protein